MGAACERHDAARLGALAPLSLRNAVRRLTVVAADLRRRARRLRAADARQLARRRVALRRTLVAALWLALSFVFCLHLDFERCRLFCFCFVLNPVSSSARSFGHARRRRALSSLVSHATTAASLTRTASVQLQQQTLAARRRAGVDGRRRSRGACAGDSAPTPQRVRRRSSRRAPTSSRRRPTRACRASSTFWSGRRAASLAGA